MYIRIAAVMYLFRLRGLLPCRVVEEKRSWGVFLYHGLQTHMGRISQIAPGGPVTRLRLVPATRLPEH